MSRSPFPLPRPADPRPGGDAGVSLIELIVAMGLMGTFMAIFTGAVLQIYGTVNRNEAIGDSQTQVTLAMGRLDKEIRYAAEVGVPGTVSGVSYAEYFTTNEGVSRCGQLRMDPVNDQLKLRSWTLGATPPAWNTVPVLVAHVDSISFPTARQTSGYQQLRIQLQASAGGAAANVTKDTDVTFAALNSTASGANTSVTTCAAGRTIP